MDTNILALLIASGMVLFVVILAIVWYILLVIAEWKIFRKFGEPGWKSIIPFYNSYIMYKYTWNVKMFVVQIVLSVIVAVIPSVSFLSVVSGVAGIAIAVINIMYLHKLSKAFGYDIAFTVGLVLLNNIFLLILGFGGSRYLGNTTESNDDSYSEY